MKLIIGLGNPGEKFKNNRHNVGYTFVDWVKKESFFGKERFFIKKTDCFMNESGKFVRKHLANLPDWQAGLTNLSNLYIVHDDLDLPLGQWKIQLGVGPKVHYGVNSVEEALGNKNFWRVRIGVDNRDPKNRISGDEYVLQDFTDGEKETLKGVFDAIIKNDSFPR